MSKLRRYKNESQSSSDEPTDISVYGGDVYAALLKDRILFITEEVTSELSSDILAKLLYLDSVNNDTITIFINSPGGDAEAMFALYDAITYIVRSKIKTVVCGEASSSAAILLAAGSPGLRYATVNSKVLIHQLSVDGFEGTATEVKIEAKSIETFKKKLTKLLSKLCNQPYDKVYEDCEKDTWLSAKEAVEYGICDYVLGPNK